MVARNAPTSDVHEIRHDSSVPEVENVKSDFLVEGSVVEEVDIDLN